MSATRARVPQFLQRGKIPIPIGIFRTMETQNSRKKGAELRVGEERWGNYEVECVKLREVGERGTI